ncbi:uncharacterized protein [Narcine bancroftii]|uniref:uncharacterized protein isoform X2 n=1 Tax=Narcine bancroftii TaxID=1343680 RepID=UPI003831CF4B
MLGRRLDPATIEEAASTTKQEEDSDRALQASLAGLKKKLPYKSEEELRPICIAESIESSLRVSKPQRTPARSRLTPSLILPPQDGADTLGSMPRLAFHLMTSAKQSKWLRCQKKCWQKHSFYERLGLRHYSERSEKERKFKMS